MSKRKIKNSNNRSPKSKNASQKEKVDFSLINNFIHNLSIRQIFFISTSALVISIVLNAFYPMKLYTIKVIIMVSILLIAIYAEQKFIAAIGNLNTKMAGNNYVKISDIKVKFFRRVNGKHNFFIPIFFIVFFGSSAITLELVKIDPLGVCCLIAFVVIVYFSIVGYMQYIYLAIFIKDLAEIDFNKADQIYNKAYPAKTEWLVDITKLYQLYRNCFFLTGSLYIIAFYIFTYKFQITEYPRVFLCWGVIFIAIVVLFPVTCLSEYINIQVIVSNIKEAAVSNYLKRIRSQENEAEYVNLIINIMETSEYPYKDLLGKGMASLLSAANLAAALYPIYTDILQPILAN